MNNWMEGRVKFTGISGWTNAVYVYDAWFCGSRQKVSVVLNQATGEIH
jgi:hypothetical protein